MRQARLPIGAVCLALVASPAAAGDAEVERSLPSYRPVAGVAGVIGAHSTAAVHELMTVWGAGFERIYPSVRVDLDDAPFEEAGGPCTFGPSVGIMREPTNTRFKERFGHAAMEIPVCLYVLGVFVHKDSPCGGGLPIEDVERLFSWDFKDPTWGDLGCAGEWSGRSIRPYAPRHHAEFLLWGALGDLFLRALRAGVLRRRRGGRCRRGRHPGAHGRRGTGARPSSSRTSRTRSRAPGF